MTKINEHFFTWIAYAIIAVVYLYFYVKGINDYETDPFCSYYVHAVIWSAIWPIHLIIIAVACGILSIAEWKNSKKTT